MLYMYYCLFGMFTILDYSSALEYNIIRRYTNIVYYYYYYKIHEDDILKIINKMDNKSSSGYDIFSNKIIKAIINEISKPLTLTHKSNVGIGNCSRQPKHC